MTYQDIQAEFPATLLERATRISDGPNLDEARSSTTWLVRGIDVATNTWVHIKVMDPFPQGDGLVPAVPVPGMLQINIAIGLSQLVEGAEVLPGLHQGDAVVVKLMIEGGMVKSLGIAGRG